MFFMCIFSRRIIGVEIDARTTKELINQSDFVLCEYHSNFPPILRQNLSKIPKMELENRVQMKSLDNQWVLCVINQSQLFYWTTSEQMRTVTKRQHGKKSKVWSSLRFACFFVCLFSLFCLQSVIVVA